MIDAMWNGERFVALVPGTHEVVATDSFLYYLPIVLGKRLPQEIIDKLAADLSVEGDLLTPYGLSCEKMSTSDDFDVARAMAKGTIIPPSNLLIATGLYEAGENKAGQAYRQPLLHGHEGRGHFLHDESLLRFARRLRRQLAGLRLCHSRGVVRRRKRVKKRR